MSVPMAELTGFLVRDRGVLLVAGLPGHGKTTLARRLESLTGAKRISVDEIRAGGRGTLDFYRWAQEEVIALRPAPAIVDACALTANYRAAVVPLLVGAGPVWCAWFNPDLTVASPRRRYVDFDRLMSLLEPPSADEGFERILTIPVGA